MHCPAAASSSASPGAERRTSENSVRSLARCLE
eukprot:CAMPEP_0114145156 /NCGR_PEP_ID=MMETSP0043_2-20121206/19902_1 /TAXON_ID=464988 /ORGANISM="Hemiselmis andersenii, Strain CCMP644" /LENGTH=32 /DNA_ID= /DNA_START= /DNA_END= /DNA_ORIENTATION=